MKKEEWIQNERERQDNCVEWFNLRVRKLVWKFRVPRSVIIELTKNYTISEIEQFEKSDIDEIKSAKGMYIHKKDLIKMKKPGNWVENYCCCMERD